MTELMFLRTALSRIVFLFVVNLMVIATVFLSTSYSGEPQSGIMDSAAVAGQKLWQGRNCVSCHSVYGLGGHIGPDLTNAVDRVGEDNARAILRYGTGRMPPQRLTPAEADHVIAYLNYLNSTGIYPTKSFPDYSFGRFGTE